MAHEPGSSTKNTTLGRPLAGLFPGAFRLTGRIVPVVLTLVALGVFLPDFVGAAGLSFETGVTQFIGWVAHALVTFLGSVLLLLIGILVWVAQYNGFIDSPAVVNGWSIIRDVSNMFFIVILLVIAFGTMLGIGRYNYRSTLAPLLIMAVLVNFSRTICGIIIDFAQVVMLTFVNGFSEAAGGNFVEAFGITKLLQLRADAPTENAAFSIVISFMLAVVLCAISVGVVLIMIGVLVARIVILWLLVVVSPLAFLARSAPFSAAEGYYAEWWGKFTKEVMIGPFMAFFLWLSLISVAGGALATDGFPESGPGTGESFSAGSSEAFSDTALQQFIIAVALLLGGTQMSLSLGGAAASVGGKVAGMVKGAGKGAARGMFRVGTGAGRLAGRGAAGVGTAVGLGKVAGAVKTGVLEKVGMNIPGLRGASARALARQNQAKAATLKEAGWVDNLSPSQRAKMAKSVKPSWAMSKEEKAVQQRSLQGLLKDTAAGKAPAEEANKYHQNKKKLLELSGNDPDVLKGISEGEAKRPSLIVDPDADAETRQAQLKKFKQVTNRLDAKGVASLAPGEITRELVDNLNEKARKGIKAGYPDLNDLVEAAATKDASFTYMSEDELVSAAGGGMTAKDAKNIPIAAVTAAVASAMSPEALGAVLGNLDKTGIKKTDLSGNTDLANKIAAAMNAEQINGLSDGMRTALAEGLATGGNAAAALGISKNMKTAFGSFDARTGNFGNAADRDAAQAMLKDESGRKAVASSLGAAGLGRNGGVNEVNIELMSSMNIGDINQMIESGDGDAAGAVLRNAERMSAMDAAALAAAAEKASVTTSDETIKKALANVEKLLKDASDNLDPKWFESKLDQADRKAKAREKQNSDRTARKVAKEEQKAARKGIV